MHVADLKKTTVLNLWIFQTEMIQLAFITHADSVDRRG